MVTPVDAEPRDADARIASLLVPLDGSRLAERALPVAAALAVRMAARLTLLHVLERQAPAQIHGEPHLVHPTNAAAYLDEVATRMRAAHALAVATHVHTNREDDVAKSIVDHAAELDTGLIVLANHGRGGLPGFVAGSIAQQVIRRGSRPVVMVPVRSTSEAQPVFACRSLAVALDGTAEAEAAVSPAIAVAAACQAVVHLIAVVPTLDTLTDERIAVATLVPGATRAALDLEEAALRDYLGRVARTVAARGLFVDLAVMRGDPAAEVVTAVERVRADLLALATHGRASIGSRILTRTQCPLLLVHAPGKHRAAHAFRW